MIPTEVFFTPKATNGEFPPIVSPEIMSIPEFEDGNGIVLPDAMFGQVIAGSPTGPFLQYMLITPQIAYEILITCPNPNQRKLKPRKVATMARLMRTGKWKGNETHQGIAFAGEFGNSTLDDGQHRLRAVVDSGTTQVFLVATYMTQFAVIDTGSTRTVSDILKMADFKNSTYLGSAIRLIQVYDKTNRPWRFPKDDITPAEFIPYAEEMSEGISAVLIYARNTVKRLGKGSPSALLAGMYLVQRWADRNSADMEARGLDLAEWFDGLATGTGLERRDPRLALCNWIVNSSDHYTSTNTADLTMLSVLRIFRAWYEGKPLNNLYFPDPGGYMFRLPGDKPSMLKAVLEKVKSEDASTEVGITA